MVLLYHYDDFYCISEVMIKKMKLNDEFIIPYNELVRLEKNNFIYMRLKILLLYQYILLLIEYYWIKINILPIIIILILIRIILIINELIFKLN